MVPKRRQRRIIEFVPRVTGFFLPGDRAGESAASALHPGDAPQP
jgi:hypothetical protein